MGETEMERLQHQLAGFRSAHEAELELLREEHALQARLLQSTVSDQQRGAEAQVDAARCEIESLKKDLEDARKEALRHKAAAEAAAVRQEAAAEKAVLEQDLEGLQPEASPIN